MISGQFKTLNNANKNQQNSELGRKYLNFLAIISKKKYRDYFKCIKMFKIVQKIRYFYLF